MKNGALKGSVNPIQAVKSAKYKLDFRKEHPEYFDPDGLLVFSGPQGSGKTLSAVQYVRNILQQYPDCIFVTNVEIQDLPPCKDVIEYDGIHCLSEINNGYAGVMYLIDELHLEFNSLESKSISIEEMTEFAQQRKQRKHIVGTSQVFMRLAKPLREQVKRVVLCQNFFGLIQHNQEIDGTTAYEEGGKLIAQVTGNYWWIHTPDLYGCYDTFAKMHRYKEAWSTRGQAPSPLPYSDHPTSIASPSSKPARGYKPVGGKPGKRTVGSGGFHITY